jgi:hypothetical protein
MRKLRRKTAQVMVRWVRFEFGMTFGEWAIRTGFINKE